MSLEDPVSLANCPSCQEPIWDKITYEQQSGKEAFSCPLKNCNAYIIRDNLSWVVIGRIYKQEPKMEAPARKS